MLEGQLVHYVLALEVIQDKQDEWQAAHIFDPGSKKLFGPQASTNFIILYALFNKL